jgi:hypothetical protein
VAFIYAGNYPLSHTLSRAVPSAFKRGMGANRGLSLFDKEVGCIFAGGGAGDGEAKLGEIDSGKQVFTFA